MQNIPKGAGVNATGSHCILNLSKGDETAKTCVEYYYFTESPKPKYESQIKFVTLNLKESKAALEALGEFRYSEESDILCSKLEKFIKEQEAEKQKFIDIYHGPNGEDLTAAEASSQEHKKPQRFDWPHKPKRVKPQRLQMHKHQEPSQ